MNNRQLEATTWTLIYAGLIGLVIGWVLRNAATGLAWAIMIAAGVAAIAGGVLLWVRSRRPDPTPTPECRSTKTRNTR